MAIKATHYSKLGPPPELLRIRNDKISFHDELWVFSVRRVHSFLLHARVAMPDFLSDIEEKKREGERESFVKCAQEEPG